MGDAPQHIADVPLTVNVSLGLATLTDDCASVDELISRADQALYKAKQGGRNQVCAWSPADAGAGPLDAEKLS